MASKDRTKVRIRARAKKLEKDEGLSPLIAEACAGIDELVEKDAAGEPTAGLYTIRTRRLDLRPRDYGPAGGSGSPPQTEGEPGAPRQGYGCQHADGQLLGAGTAKGAPNGPALP